MFTIDQRFVTWPREPLAAAAMFYNEKVPEIRDVLDPTGTIWQEAGAVPDVLDGATIILPPADHSHEGWRLAAIQELARQLAPRRVNAIVGCDQESIDTTIEYLANAPGVTGQVFTIDGKSGEID